jgi:hypothetical protein
LRLRAPWAAFAGLPAASGIKCRARYRSFPVCFLHFRRALNAAMSPPRILAVLFLVSRLASPVRVAAADDDYTMMLGYLANSRIDDHAMRAAAAPAA